jgi:hypothetical protein
MSEQTQRERVEAAADRVAALLEIDAEDVLIEASGSGSAFLVLRAGQAEKLLDLAEIGRTA